MLLRDLEAPYLDVTAPGFAITGPEVHQAREQSWWARTPYGIAVLRYDDVRVLLRSRRLRQGSAAWPAHNGVTGGLFADWFASWILNIEGEQHDRLRRLMNPAFSRKLIASMAPRFAGLADELIDCFAGRGHCEFMAEFADPYAARVLAMMLGLPQEQWPVIAAESAQVGRALGVNLRAELPAVEAALQRLYDFADEVIADRQRSPQDDFVTALVSASQDAERLSGRELRDGLVLLIFGGYDTTRSQLSLAMATFAAHPDQWQLLAGRPDLGAAAVEEVMRVNPTVRWVTRETLTDVEHNGVTIPAGTTVHLFSEAAGTDPAVFGEYSFDITAARPPHVGFGGGAHHCIGHFVARSDMSEALPLLARRLGTLRLGDGAAWLPDSGNTGASRLPISFTPVS